MTSDLRKALADVAENSPPLRVQSGIFDSARRARNHHLIGGLAVTIMALIISGLLIRADRQLPPTTPAGQVDQMPAYLVEAPLWTADVEHAPIPRALAVFREDDSDELTLVGPDDQYRTFDPGGDWTNFYRLSSDGMRLMTGHDDDRTQLLDIATGETRMVDGKPIEWGGDSRHVLVKRAAEGNTQVEIQIRVVDSVDGHVAWSVSRTEWSHAEINAALSPDAQTLLVKVHAGLTAYRQNGGLLWTGTLDEADLTSHWLANDLTSVTAAYGPCVLSTTTGKKNKCMGYQQYLRGLEGGFGGLWFVVEWTGSLPIMNLGHVVIRVAPEREILLKAPKGVQNVQVAGLGVEWSKREPGAPDGGPILARFHLIILIGMPVLGLFVWWRVRRRQAAGRLVR